MFYVGYLLLNAIWQKYKTVLYILPLMFQLLLLMLWSLTWICADGDLKDQPAKIQLRDSWTCSESPIYLFSSTFVPHFQLGSMQSKRVLLFSTHWERIKPTSTLVNKSGLYKWRFLTYARNTNYVNEYAKYAVNPPKNHLWCHFLFKYFEQREYNVTFTISRLKPKNTNINVLISCPSINKV